MVSSGASHGGITGFHLAALTVLLESVHILLELGGLPLESVVKKIIFLKVSGYSNISLEENSSCLQTTMTKFKLKRSGDKWFLELTAGAPCTKKQVKEVSIPNSSPSNVQNEPLDRRSYMEALGGEEGNINKSRPCVSRSVEKEKRNNVGCNKKRGNDLHRLLFLPNGLPDRTELTYRVNGKDILNGYKQGNGILCSECNTEISPSQFEAHAKYSYRRQPYNYICTPNGNTLHEIALRLSYGESIQSILSSSNDKCAVCGVGGELFDCDGCPCAYHAVCLGLEGIPTGDWHCSRCTENIGPNGRDSSPVISQPDRVVKPPVYQPGGCFLCRAQEFSVDTFDELKIKQCYQCGRQYHVSCLLDIRLCNLKELSKDEWFCCSDCNSIHSTMQGLLLKENKVLLASVLEKHIGKGVTDGAVNSIHWQILSGTSRSTDSRLLSKAAAIFKESFKTIRSKTCCDLIAAAVHGKNISDQESRQLYCVVLVVNSVVSSASVLRIISREIAELPVVATRKKYQGKGYFQELFSCIEQLLVSMKVKKIVLPAAEVAESMWTKLGFKKISDEQLSEYTKDFQLTTFSDTSIHGGSATGGKTALCLIYENRKLHNNEDALGDVALVEELNVADNNRANGQLDVIHEDAVEYVRTAQDGADATDGTEEVKPNTDKDAKPVRLMGVDADLTNLKLGIREEQLDPNVHQCYYAFFSVELEPFNIGFARL
ncbi:Increased DNA methylation like [Heracleum sosnowskyi]|uniref:Increased DNA methylation like n=1 Tax=Heracleum sosnowskyi TaxID=360622 RepID=A0AAD8M6L7_9APIA|nr:Increased DNA methylation like [Heracleum sosnowskyi]